MKTPFFSGFPFIEIKSRLAVFLFTLLFCKHSSVMGAQEFGKFGYSSHKVGISSHKLLLLKRLKTE